MGNRALIAMSGGVDSAVAAYLTKKEGFECAGAIMRLNGTVGSGHDIEDAEKVAKRLGMPFYIFEMEEEFKSRVIKRFAGAYEKGETPNPCILCNKYLKFDLFYKKALELGFDTVVTGHYARIIKSNGEYGLYRAKDRSKDQSYVLYPIKKEVLSHTSFPLGEMSKENVRKTALEQGFVNSGKPDSQDICFIPDGDYGEFLRKYTGKDYPGGEFVDIYGNVLGEHKGIINYTIGQRKGLGISGDSPFYVCRIDAGKNQVILGKNEDLFSKELVAGEFNWLEEIKYNNKELNEEELNEEEHNEKEIKGREQTMHEEKYKRVQAKVRYRHEPSGAYLKVLEDGSVKIIFDEPQRAITRGQSAVAYDGDRVIGGGVIL